ncbi:hypothetical protein [Piscinibacter sp.]|jgi:hypothetical protein|uniref:hypothetical protein n=1 Tax=Piscinibacter sp. TaxID=1903157 RepID=UPI00355A51E1
MRSSIPLQPPSASQISALQSLAREVVHAPSKRAARPLVRRLHDEAAQLRTRLPPLVASSVSRLVRCAEAASGAVIEKALRLEEFNQACELLLRLLDGC